MIETANGLERALSLYRNGDHDGARRLGEAALADDPINLPLLRFLGVAACRAGEMRKGADYLIRAFDLDPKDFGTRFDLVNALIILGEMEEAEAYCGEEEGENALKLGKLRGHIQQSQGRLAEAAASYEQILARDPGDFETWNNLGNVRRSAGDLQGAVAALRRAVALRPDIAIIHVNLGGALAGLGRLEESLRAFREAARKAPNDPACLLELGRACCRSGRDDEALAAFDAAARQAPADPQIPVEIGLVHAGRDALDLAEAAYRKALAIKPDHAPAYIALGTLLENSNRAGELETLLNDTDARGVAAEELSFVRALSLRRAGKLEAALEQALRAPVTTDPNRKAHLIGEIADRLGDSTVAFAAFEEMNRIVAADPSNPRRGAAEYRRELKRMADLTTPQWVAGWSEACPDTTRPAPVFLVGFPRSGTTLLDTVLMGHPDVHVLEEEPVLQAVSDMLGDPASLARLTKGEVDALRARYFEECASLAPASAGRLVIDKFPLHMARAPLIHRIFPDAKFIFLQRHPCDVVLSCFMQNFKLNYAMANFLDIGDAARLYDLVVSYWATCRKLFPLHVQDLRYERMIEDMEGELRSLLTFLDLPWNAAVLDHQRTAARRGYISSPSYAQVTERIYTRASGRWERYREQMSDVLPILAPWVEHYGYEM